MAVDLLYYRPWTGEFRSSWFAVWPIARQSLVMMFRRKLFWVLYGLALIIFCLFFFGQYMLFWAETQVGQESVRVGTAGPRVDPGDLIKLFRGFLKLNGTGETYYNFFWYQGYMVMIVLALAGSLLIGNDIRHGSLPFYLSKPISSHHYLAGKCLAIAVFINLLTTIPALVLFVQYGLLDTYDYFQANWQTLLGILAYGLVLTVFLSLLLTASAVWLRKTIPLIGLWVTLFFFCRQLGIALVDRLGLDPRWKLIDLWNSLSVVGYWLLGCDPAKRGQQPEVYEASFVLLAVSTLCLIYLIQRIRAVEIVS